jgi:hypothetical protein
MTRPTRRSGMKAAKESIGCFEHRLQVDARFLRRIERARGSLKAGICTRLEDVEAEE